MKVLDLTCAQGHHVSRAGSRPATNSQRSASAVCWPAHCAATPTCIRCRARRGSTWAPWRPPGRDAERRHAGAGRPQAQWLRAVRHMIEHTEDVGERFADEARRIHYGEVAQRHPRPGHARRRRGAARGGHRVHVTAAAAGAEGTDAVTWSNAGSSTPRGARAVAATGRAGSRGGSRPPITPIVQNAAHRCLQRGRSWNGPDAFGDLRGASRSAGAHGSMPRGCSEHVAPKVAAVSAGPTAAKRRPAAGRLGIAARLPTVWAAPARWHVAPRFTPESGSAQWTILACRLRLIAIPVPWRSLSPACSPWRPPWGSVDSPLRRCCR